MSLKKGIGVKVSNFNFQLIPFILFITQFPILVACYVLIRNPIEQTKCHNFYFFFSTSTFDISY